MYRKLTKEVLVEEVFDDDGRILSRKDMDGKTIWVYSETGKLVEKRLNDTILLFNLYDSYDKLIYSYDEYRECIQEIEYNSIDKYSHIKETNKNAVINYIFEYDNKGREIRIIANIENSNEKYTVECITEYNDQNKTKTMYTTDSNDIYNYSKYDENDNEIYSISYNKISNNYIEVFSEYNNGKIISEETYIKDDKDSTERKLDSKITYEYDKNGNLIKYKSDSYVTNYEYDDKNRCIHEYNNSGDHQWFEYIDN